MSLTFAISDLHGRYDLLELALAAIEAHEPMRKRRIVFTGDYVDRGPDSAKICERLMDGQKRGEPWICLKGNHEDMMVQAVRYGDFGWAEGQGKATVESFNKEGTSARRLVEICDWANALPMMHVCKHRIFVHAAVDPTLHLTEQKAETLMWERYPTGFAMGYRGKHVVHGHTPDTRNPRTWGDRTCLDTGAFKTGRLVVGVYEDYWIGPAAKYLEVLA